MGRQSLFNNRIGTDFGSKKWLSLDPCGIACATLSYSIHIYAIITMYHHLIPDFSSSSSPSITDNDNLNHSRTDMQSIQEDDEKQDGLATVIHILFYALYVPMSILALLSLAMAQHSNPGAVPLGARPLPITCSPVSSPVNSHQSSTGDAGAELQNDTYIDNHNANQTNGSNDDGKNLLTSVCPLDATDSDYNHGNLSPNNSRRMKLQRRRGIRRCRKCNDNYKPPRAHHDSVTGRCVVKFDHFWYVQTML